LLLVFVWQKRRSSGKSYNFYWLIFFCGAC
jgi:hypothetical protein